MHQVLYSGSIMVNKKFPAMMGLLFQWEETDYKQINKELCQAVLCMRKKQNKTNPK